MPDEPVVPSVPENAAVTVVRIHEVQQTIRVIAICATVLLIAGIVGFVLLRIYTHEFWLEVIAILFGPSGFVVLLVRLFIGRIKKKIDAARSQQANQATPAATASTPPGIVKGGQP